MKPAAPLTVRVEAADFMDNNDLYQLEVTDGTCVYMLPFLMALINNSMTPDTPRTQTAPRAPLRHQPSLVSLIDALIPLLCTSTCSRIISASSKCDLVVFKHHKVI